MIRIPLGWGGVSHTSFECGWERSEFLWQLAQFFEQVVRIPLGAHGNRSEFLLKQTDSCQNPLGNRVREIRNPLGLGGWV